MVDVGTVVVDDDDDEGDVVVGPAVVDADDEGDVEVVAGAVVAGAADSSSLHAAEPSTSAAAITTIEIRRRIRRPYRHRDGQLTDPSTPTRTGADVASVVAADGELRPAHSHSMVPGGFEVMS